MIIYGSKATQLAKESITDKCPHCGTQNSIDMHVFQRYAHVFWIPFVPIGKIGVSQCDHCKQVLKQKEMPTALKAAYENVKAQTKTPFWTFIGLGLLLVLITSGVVSSNNKDAANAKLIEAPHKGDVFEIKTKELRYTLVKVEEVLADSVYLRPHNYSIDKSSGLYKLRQQGDTAYSDNIYAVSKQGLKKMFEKGDIINIIR